MLLKKENHVKTKGPKKSRRITKVTTISIDPVKYQTVKELNLNLSLIVNEFLDEYLKLNFPGEYRKNTLKKSL